MSNSDKLNVLVESIKLLKFRSFVESLEREDQNENKNAINKIIKTIDSIIEAYVPSDIIRSYLKSTWDLMSEEEKLQHKNKDEKGLYTKKFTELDSTWASLSPSEKNEYENILNYANEVGKKMLSEDNSEKTQNKVIDIIMQAAIKIIARILNTRASILDIDQSVLEDAIQDFALYLTKRVREVANNKDKNDEIVTVKDGVVKTIDKYKKDLIKVDEDDKEEDDDEDYDEEEDDVDNESDFNNVSDDLMKSYWVKHILNRSLKSTSGQPYVINWNKDIAKERNGFRLGTIVFYDGKYYKRTSPVPESHPDFKKSKSMPINLITEPPSSEKVSKYWVEVEKPSFIRAKEIVDDETGDVVDITNIDVSSKITRDIPIGDVENIPPLFDKLEKLKKTNEKEFYDILVSDEYNKVMSNYLKEHDIDAKIQKIIMNMYDDAIKDIMKDIEKNIKSENLSEVEKLENKLNTLKNRKKALLSLYGFKDYKDTLMSEKKTYPSYYKRTDKDKEELERIQKEIRNIPKRHEIEKKYKISLSKALDDFGKEFIKKYDLKDLSPTLKKRIEEYIKK